MVYNHTMPAKTYTVGSDTAESVEQLREQLGQRWHVQPTYSQVIRHAVSVALARLEEEGRGG